MFDRHEIVTKTTIGSSSGRSSETPCSFPGGATALDSFDKRGVRLQNLLATIVLSATSNNLCVAYSLLATAMEMTMDYPKPTAKRRPQVTVACERCQKRKIKVRTNHDELLLTSILMTRYNC